MINSDEEILFRLMFPDAFSQIEEMKSIHGLDLTDEIHATMRAEYNARINDE